jgi:ribonuclease HI
MPHELHIFTDGGARGNPGPGACAFVVQTSAHHTIFQQGIFLGPVTNNQAEYAGVLHALTWLSTSECLTPALTVNFFLDSLLVVNQLKGLYKIKDPHLKEFNQEIKKIIANFQLLTVNFTHIPRSQNALADALLNQVLDTHTLDTSSS